MKVCLNIVYTFLSEPFGIMQHTPADAVQYNGMRVLYIWTQKLKPLMVTPINVVGCLLSFSLT